MRRGWSRQPVELGRLLLQPSEGAGHDALGTRRQPDEQLQCEKAQQQRNGDDPERVQEIIPGEIVRAEKCLHGDPAHVAQNTDDRRVHQDLQPHPAEAPGHAVDLPLDALRPTGSTAVPRPDRPMRCGASMPRTAGSKRPRTSSSAASGHRSRPVHAVRSQRRLEPPATRERRPPFPTARLKTPSADGRPRREHRGDTAAHDHEAGPERQHPSHRADPPPGEASGRPRRPGLLHAGSPDSRSAEAAAAMASVWTRARVRRAASSVCRSAARSRPASLSTTACSCRALSTRRSITRLPRPTSPNTRPRKLLELVEVVARSGRRVPCRLLQVPAGAEAQRPVERAPPSLL